MFLRLKHGEHWLYKPRKKKPGMKQRFSKDMRKWLKDNVSEYKLIKDGPLSGILIKDENQALVFKLTWFNDSNSKFTNFIKRLF